MILDEIYSYIIEQTSQGIISPGQDIRSAGLHVRSDPETRAEILVVSQPGAVYIASPGSGGQLPRILHTIFNYLNDRSPQDINRLGLHLIMDPDTREQIRTILLPEGFYIESPQMISELPPGIPCEACQGSGIRS
jgi:hypothetical protein